MKSKALLLAAAVITLCAAVLVPAAGARSAGVSIKLRGPDSAALGKPLKLTATISNPQRADGYRVAVIMQNKNGHLVRIGSKAITWSHGGRKGIVVFAVKGEPSAMGIAMYRAAWMHPMGTTRSNVCRVEID